MQTSSEEVGTLPVLHLAASNQLPPAALVQLSVHPLASADAGISSQARTAVAANSAGVDRLRPPPLAAPAREPAVQIAVRSMLPPGVVLCRSTNLTPRSAPARRNATASEDQYQRHAG